jgi:hypothetical protein
MKFLKKHNLIYKITNIVNNKIYIGCHQTYEINDKYMGSGDILKKALIKYGIDKFIKEILYDFETPEEMFLMERTIVNAEFVKRKDTYNIKIGGLGGWGNTKGKIFVKDNQNKYCWVEKDDPRFLSGELVYANLNQFPVFNENGEYFMVEKDDPRFLNGELKHFIKNKVVVKDETGKTFLVSKDDPKYISGELKFIWTGLKHSEETKRKIGEKNSQHQKGENNSQYGKCWIHNLELKQSKCVLKDGLEKWIQLGWVKGRKMDFSK